MGQELNQRKMWRQSSPMLYHWQHFQCLVTCLKKDRSPSGKNKPTNTPITKSMQMSFLPSHYCNIPFGSDLFKAFLWDRLKILQTSANLGTMGFFCPDINSIQHSELTPSQKQDFQPCSTWKCSQGKYFWQSAIPWTPLSQTPHLPTYNLSSLSLLNP